MTQKACDIKYTADNQKDHENINNGHAQSLRCHNILILAAQCCI